MEPYYQTYGSVWNRIQQELDMVSLKLKTPQDIKNEWRYAGITMSDWARKHGFCKATVSQVLNGRNTASRGVGHRIAVQLGIKDGVIGEEVVGQQ